MSLFRTGTSRSNSLRSARPPAGNNVSRPSGHRHEVKPRRPTLMVQISTYFSRHIQMMLYSLGKICATPLSSIMTVGVIGMALALPAGLYVVLDNIQGVSTQWETTAQISLFLKPGLGDKEIEQLVTRLSGTADIAQVTYISPEEALAEFRRISGFGEALNALDHNPLPAVLIIHPAIEQSNAKAVERLVDTLRREPVVEIAELDMDWIKRFFAIMAIGQRTIVVMAGLLALAVLLIIGNTIRMGIQNRRDEIEIMKLIGATDTFIRRPFLYSGMWYGLFGGVLGWGIVHGSLWLLRGPVGQLSLLYDSAFDVNGMDTVSSLILLGISSLLGLLGSRFTVGKYLRAIEPV